MGDTKKHLKGEEYLVTHAVGPNRTGFRLDRFLMERYRRRSREQLKRAIESGAITVVRNTSPHLSLGKMKASFVLQAGDIVQVLSIRRPEPPVNFNYQVLYEDEDIVVVDKPPNLPVHPAGRFFFNTLLVHLKTDGFKSALESERRYFLVHRIDKETSGVLLLAKTKESCNALTGQFRNRETDKYYLAIVKGEPATKVFDVDSPIGKIPKSRVGLKMYPLPVERGGLPSHTHFEWIESRENRQGRFSLLACFPRTGRQHQIRVHADLAGHPLVGDKIYGMPDDDVLALMEGHREDLRSESSPEPADADDVVDEEAELEPEDAIAEDPPSKEVRALEPSFEIPGPTATLYAELEAKLLLPRHALHAAGLRFKHPRTGEEMVFESQLPDDLRTFFEGINGAPLQPFKTKHW